MNLEQLGFYFEDNIDTKGNYISLYLFNKHGILSTRVMCESRADGLIKIYEQYWREVWNKSLSAS